MFKTHYGINIKLNSLFYNFMGYHLSFKKDVNTSSYINVRLSKLLTNNNNLLNNSLRKEYSRNILKKIRTNSYQGLCFKNNFPVRGQRRRSNSKTTRKTSTFFFFKRSKFSR